MDGHRTLDPVPAKGAPQSADRFAAALAGGVSALVTGPGGTLALLARTRTRLLRVRPPLDLPSFMQQLDAARAVLGNVEAERGFDLLTVPGPTCDQIVLVVEDPSSLPEPTLRYIEFALRAGPHLQVAFTGPAEAVSAPALDTFERLRERLLLSPESPELHRPRPMPTVEAQASPSSPWASWMLQPPPRRRRLRSSTMLACALVAAGLGLVAWIGRSVVLPTDDAARVGQGAPRLTDSAGPLSARDPDHVAPTMAAREPAPSASFPPAGSTTASQPRPAAILDHPGPDAALRPPAGSPDASAADATAAPVAASATPAVAASVSAGQQATPPTVAPTAPASRPPEVESVIPRPAMIALPGATFRMGSGEDRSERPLHMVTVRRFSIAEHATTVREWQACVDARVCVVEPTGKPQDPVTNVSWDDARQYAGWVSGVTRQRYRLPTEAEWEYAARAGTTTRYSWGDAMLPDKAGCKGCNASGDPHDPPWVGAYPANRFNLYGMGGGVAEWVADCWHRDYAGAPADGSVAWDAPNCHARVLRGGSWMDDASAVRPSSREYYDAPVRYPTHGFRVALSE